MERMRHQWVEFEHDMLSLGFSKYRGQESRCLHRLRNLGCFDSMPCLPPVYDHQRLWVRERRPCLFTAWIYVLAEPQKKEIISFCQRFGFGVGFFTYEDNDSLAILYTH